MSVLKRPETFDEGVRQIKQAVQETTPHAESTTPRAKLWKSVDTLFNTSFLSGLKILYDANRIVSFLFNTIVPHIEERLRFDLLEREHERSMQKPESAAQNKARFEAILSELKAKDKSSRLREVDAPFAQMRDAMRDLQREEVLAGLSILYVSSKTARKALDLILQRLIDTFAHDSSIVRTTDIPFDAMFLS